METEISKLRIKNAQASKKNENNDKVDTQM